MLYTQGTPYAAVCKQRTSSYKHVATAEVAALLGQSVGPAAIWIQRESAAEKDGTRFSHALPRVAAYGVCCAQFINLTSCARTLQQWCRVSCPRSGRCSGLARPEFMGTCKSFNRNDFRSIQTGGNQPTAKSRLLEPQLNDPSNHD